MFAWYTQTRPAMSNIYTRTTWRKPRSSREQPWKRWNDWIEENIKVTLKKGGKTGKRQEETCWQTCASIPNRLMQIIIIIMMMTVPRVITNKKKRRTSTELWTLPFQLTTVKNWRKAKRELSTETLLENWKNMEHEGDGDTNCNWRTRYSHQRTDTRTEGLWSYSIVEISQNTKKSPWDLRVLAVTQTRVKNPQLTLVLHCIPR